MNEYHLSKIETLRWVSKGLKFLNLPKTKINIEVCDYDSDRFFCFYPNDYSIDVYLLNIDFLAEGYILNLYNFTTKEGIIFAIFHEIAHYFQHFKHLNWTKKFPHKEYCYFNDDEEYNKQKPESNANTIAKIMYNHLYLTPVERKG